jgi:exportin-2 (importin alpha re-exporter)
VSTSVCHNLFDNAERSLIPNVTLTEFDCELFEDNPNEYISRDIEGSDSDTRRRAACELVKGLRKHYEQSVSLIFESYIGLLLERHAATGDWRAKDAALYLVTALSVTAATAARGASTTNPFVNVIDFYGQRVLPELQQGAAAGAAPAADVGEQVLRADALRFSSVFRQTLPVAAYSTLLPLFVGLLRSPNVVVQTYAAACVENFLGVKDRLPPPQKPVPRVTPALLGPLLAAAVENLCALLPSAAAGAAVRENPYVMRAVMRLITTAKDAVLPHCSELSRALVVALAAVSANPLNTTFNHFLFESLAALIAPLLSAVLWERAGNIPPLVRLLQAYARRGPELLVPHIEPTFGVFQQLLASRNAGGSSFNQLANAVRADNDPFAAIVGDLRLLVATRFAEAAHARPGELQPLIQQASPDAQQVLARYLTAAGLSI